MKCGVKAAHCEDTQRALIRQVGVMYRVLLMKLPEHLLMWCHAQVNTYLAAVRTLSKNNVEALPAGGQRSQPLREEKVTF